MLKDLPDDLSRLQFLVDKDSEHVGGMNLFGSRFGDYAQDIIMSVEYESG